MDKELSKRVWEYFKAQGLKPRYRSSKWFFQVWFPLTEESRKNHSVGSKLEFIALFSAKDRNMALDAIYGMDFKRNADNPNAGNISGNGMSMRETEWLRFITNVNNYSELNGKSVFIDPNSSCEGYRELYV